MNINNSLSIEWRRTCVNKFTLSVGPINWQCHSHWCHSSNATIQYRYCSKVWGASTTQPQTPAVMKGHIAWNAKSFPFAGADASNFYNEGVKTVIELGEIYGGGFPMAGHSPERRRSH